MTVNNWLLLLHQIPPTPPYFRAKVLRRLNQFGALAIKNSVYIVPENDDTKEDFEWLRSEISAEGGEAWLFRAEAMAGLSADALAKSFRNLRAEDYRQLLDQAQALVQREEEKNPADLRKLQRRFNEVRRMDFFNAAGREELESMLHNIEATLRGTSRELALRPGLEDLKGRTWVTRRGVKVDRIACAWLIRRFLDPAARFLFVDPDHYQPAPGEIRFDMFDGEFTHEGDLSSFEVLVKYVELHDRGLDLIAEIVHDIDLKDEKFQRPETSGIAAMISGIISLHAADEQRVEEGARLWESIYTALK